MPPRKIILKSSSSASSTESIAKPTATHDTATMLTRRSTRGSTNRPESTPKSTTITISRNLRSTPRKNTSPASSTSRKKSKTKKSDRDTRALQGSSGAIMSDDYDEDEDVEVSSNSDDVEEEEEEDEGKSEYSDMDEELLSDSETVTSVAPSDRPLHKLTTRQRALLQAETLSLDSSPSLEALNNTIELPKISEEEMLRKSELSRRRKSQRDQKLEQTKAETIQRLLQKQSSRSKKMKKSTDTIADDPNVTNVELKGPDMFADGPTPRNIRFLSDKTGTRLILGSQITLFAECAPTLQEKPLHCSIKGCRGQVKYRSARSMQPICSLDCYQKL